MKGFVPARSVVIPGSYTKSFPAGDFQVPCALIIGKRKPSTDLKHLSIMLYANMT
jgi:2,3,4,5-tetrahydropyridine-2-carboxylate N-succinyltransferase